jgi:hypothetical protein
MLDMAPGTLPSITVREAASRTRHPVSDLLLTSATAGRTRPEYQARDSRLGVTAEPERCPMAEALEARSDVRDR